MTKLTDIPGASEILPNIDNNYNSHIRVGYAMAKDVLDFTHLEVDVEAMRKIVRETDTVDTDYISTTDLNLIGEAIALNFIKWARLVRK